MYQFAENLRSDRAFLFDSGSTALYALLKSISIAQDDEVILQSFTCTSVPFTVLRLHATPVYVDIEPSTLNLDPGSVEVHITKRTKAIIVQHTFGVAAEMDAILEIAHRHDLWVIEDACHSLGAKYKGKEVGTFGDAAIYSFGWYKPISLGQGGAATVNNPELTSGLRRIHQRLKRPKSGELAALYLKNIVFAMLYSPSRFWRMKEVYRRMRDLRFGPRKGSLEALIRGQSSKAAKMTDSELSAWYQIELTNILQTQITSEQNGKLNGKTMTPLEKMRLSRKLTHWNEVVAHQKWVVSTYRELLSDIGIQPADLQAYLEPVYYKYPVVLDPSCKEIILTKARAAGIELSDMFGSPLHPPERAAQWKVLGYKSGMCPISEDISSRIIALPVHTRVRASQIGKTVRLLASHLDS